MPGYCFDDDHGINACARNARRLGAFGPKSSTGYVVPAAVSANQVRRLAVDTMHLEDLSVPVRLVDVCRFDDDSVTHTTSHRCLHRCVDRGPVSMSGGRAEGPAEHREDVCP
jgi:hypothetical protein